MALADGAFFIRGLTLTWKSFTNVALSQEKISLILLPKKGVDPEEN
jgi:hypothetical protein